MGLRTVGDELQIWLCGHKSETISLLVSVSLFLYIFFYRKWDWDQKWDRLTFMALEPAASTQWKPQQVKLCTAYKYMNYFNIYHVHVLWIILIDGTIFMTSFHFADQILHALWHSWNIWINIIKPFASCYNIITVPVTIKL